MCSCENQWMGATYDPGRLHPKYAEERWIFLDWLEEVM